MITTRRGRPGTLALLVIAWALQACNPQFSDPLVPDFAPCPDGKPCSKKCPEAGPCADAATCGEAGLCPDRGPCPDAVVPDAMVPDTGVPPSYPLALGGPLEDLGRTIGVDSSGNVFVAGTFRGTAAFGSLTATSAGATDGFLAKVNPTGKVLWVLRVGNLYLNGFSVTVDRAKGQAYIHGTFSSTLSIGSKVVNCKGASDIFVAKVDKDGKVLWAVSAGGGKGDSISATTLDAAGNLYVMGHIVSPAMFGTKVMTTKAGSEAFVAKLTPNGVWAATPFRTFGEKKIYPRGIAVDSTGYIYVTGRFNLDKVTFNGVTLTLTPNSKVMAKDKLKKPIRWTYDIFRLKMDSAGKPKSAVSAGSIEDDEGSYIVVDKSDYTYIAGRMRADATFGTHKTGKPKGFWDVFVTRLKPDGTFLWVAPAGGAYEDHVAGLAVAPTGQILLSGSFRHKGTFGAHTVWASKDPSLKFGSIDAFAAQVDATKGTFLKVHSAGGHGKDYGGGVAADNKGIPLVTGRFMDQATFGKATLTSHGDNDAFIWKVIP